MIRRLDHIAIAVPDLEAAISRFAEDIGLPLKGVEDVVGQKTTTAFQPAGETQIELIHPMDGQGPVQAFLDKRGGGLHHLCFETDDIDADVARLKKSLVSKHVNGRLRLLRARERGVSTRGRKCPKHYVSAPKT